MRKAVDVFLDRTGGHERDGHWLWPACNAAADLWDEEAWRALCERHVRLARRSGTLIALPLALRSLALAYIHAGEFGEAATLIDDAYTIAEGGRGPSWAELALAAWRGDRERVSLLVETSLGAARDRRQGRALSMIDYANVVLHNGTGRYDVALRAARTAYHLDEPGFRSFIPPELVEAAARSGRPRLAEPVLEQLVPGEPHRLGARHPGSLARPPQRRARSRGPVPGGDRPARAYPERRPPRPGAPGLRRVAAPRGQTR